MEATNNAQIIKEEKPMRKCVNCGHCEIHVDEFKNAKARCKLKVPPKQGKIIAGACTTYLSKFDASIGKVHKLGKNMVKEELHRKRKVPIWCPLNAELLIRT